MHLVINIDYTNAIAIPSEHAAAVMSALAQAKIIKREGYGSDGKFIPTDSPLEFSLRNLDLTPMSEREISLAKTADERNSAWATAYTENEANKKRIKELEAKLHGVGNAA